MTRRRLAAGVVAAAILASAPAFVVAQRGGRGGGAQEGPRLPRPVTRLFTQDAYTQYEILEPGSASFRIKYLPETTRAGATEIVNATRAGSEGSGIEVYDPRTGLPLEFTYEQQGSDPDAHAIHAKLPFPVPEGGIGRVLIFKTYTDPATYLTNGDEIVWTRTLSGYRLGVILPSGYALTSSTIAAQLSTLPDGRLKLAFANPSGQGNDFTLHARPAAAPFPPTTYEDMFFDDMKTLYDLDAPATGRVRVEQTYSDYRHGPAARLDSLAYLRLGDMRVVDLDTAKPLPTRQDGGATVATLEVPITREHQSAHIRITGTLTDGYRADGDGLVFERELRGLRNTVLLPEGYEVQSVSESATIGQSGGRTFVALINLNAANAYRVTIRARRQGQ